MGTFFQMEFMHLAFLRLLVCLDKKAMEYNSFHLLDEMRWDGMRLLREKIENFFSCKKVWNEKIVVMLVADFHSISFLE